MKIEKLKPGQIVYDLHKERMGNTTMTTWGVWPVKIVSVDVEKGRVEASWNGNPSRAYFGRSFSKWKAKEPVMVKVGTYGRRPATRAEIKAMQHPQS